MSPRFQLEWPPIPLHVLTSLMAHSHSASARKPTDILARHQPPVSAPGTPGTAPMQSCCAAGDAVCTRPQRWSVPALPDIRMLLLVTAPQ